MEETFMMNEEFLTLTIGKQKNIALIAHDSKKPELISCAGQGRRPG